METKIRLLLTIGSGQGLNSVIASAHLYSHYSVRTGVTGEIIRPALLAACVEWGLSFFCVCFCFWPP